MTDIRFTCPKCNLSILTISEAAEVGHNCPKNLRRGRPTLTMFVRESNVKHFPAPSVSEGVVAAPFGDVQQEPNGDFTVQRAADFPIEVFNTWDAVLVEFGQKL